MAKLVKIYETEVTNHEGKKEIHELRITTNKDVASISEAIELSYNDFDFDLHIDGRYISNINNLISVTNNEAYQNIIDDTNWVKYFTDEKAEQN